jgi:hypothetical protein
LKREADTPGGLERTTTERNERTRIHRNSEITAQRQGRHPKRGRVQVLFLAVRADQIHREGPQRQDPSVFPDYPAPVARNAGAEREDACVFPSRPRPASRSNRPDTYQRLPLSTHNLRCETQPVHKLGQNAKCSSRLVVFRFGSKLGHCSVLPALRICATGDIGDASHPNERPPEGDLNSMMETELAGHQC